MEESIKTALWKATERAQLERFLIQYKDKDIQMGELTYRISNGFIEKQNGMAEVELIQRSTGRCFDVRLGLIDINYNSYTALGQASRLDMIWDLGIMI